MRYAILNTRYQLKFFGSLEGKILIKTGNTKQHLASKVFIIIINSPDTKFRKKSGFKITLLGIIFRIILRGKIGHSSLPLGLPGEEGGLKGFYVYIALLDT